MWSIGESIKNLREFNNMTRNNLADILNVTSKTIGNWENNERQPSLDIVIKLSEIFNVPTDYILKGKMDINLPDGGIMTLKFKDGNFENFDILKMQDFIEKLESSKIDAKAFIEELNKSQG